VSSGSTHRKRDEEIVGASADEDLIDVFSSDFSVIGYRERNFEAVDENVKKLVPVDLTVCLKILGAPSGSRRSRSGLYRC